MDQLLLAVPALLPLAGGMGLLLASQLGPGVKHQKVGLNQSGRGQISQAQTALAGPENMSGENSSRRYHFLKWYVELITVVNSLVLLWLVFHADGQDHMVLFRLYGPLRVSFCLDRMGKVFAALISVLWPLAVLYSFEYMKEEDRKGPFFAYYLMTYGVTAGIALAGNLITLYLFYEMLTLATFPLVLFPMTREAVRASRKYLYYSIGGAAFAFLGLVFVLTFSAIGSTDFRAGGMLDVALASSRKNTLLFIYLLAFFGFGVKAVVFPCHKWLPLATVAPTPVTALLHAVAVVKSGAFAILRLTYFSFGAGFLAGTWAQWAVMIAAMVTIVYGSTMAVKEVHWKRRLAYSTTSNLSYILLAASMMSPWGLAAALAHMVFHAFMKICSFFCAGAVMHQTGKTYVYELDGLGRQMPVTFACLTVASLSLVGIPPLAGFISKWNIAGAAFVCGMENLAGSGGAGAVPLVAGSGTGAVSLAAGSGAGAVSLILGHLAGLLPFAAVFVLLYSALMTGIYMLTVVVRAYLPARPMAGVSLTGSGSGAGVSLTGSGSGAGVSLTGSGSGAGVSLAGSGSGADVSPVGQGHGEPEHLPGSATDPNWMMLVPLVIFVAVILGLGLYSQPLMTFLLEIGGDAP